MLVCCTIVCFLDLGGSFLLKKCMYVVYKAACFKLWYYFVYNVVFGPVLDFFRFCYPRGWYKIYMLVIVQKSHWGIP